MRETSATLLSDIGTFARRIMTYTDGLQLEGYLETAIVRDAVERNLQTLGEAAVRLRRSDPETASRVPDIERIIGLRNRLAHGYFDEINDELIWATITTSIPVLIREVDQILAALEDS